MTIKPDVTVYVSDFCDDEVVELFTREMVYGVVTGRISSQGMGHLSKEFGTFISSIETRADTLRGIYSRLKSAEVRLLIAEQELGQVSFPMSLRKKMAVAGMGTLGVFFCGSLLWLLVSRMLFGAYTGMLPTYQVVCLCLVTALPCLLLLAIFGWFYDLWKDEMAKRVRRLNAERKLEGIQVQMSELCAAWDAEVAPWTEQVRCWFQQGKIRQLKQGIQSPHLN